MPDTGCGGCLAGFVRCSWLPCGQQTQKKADTSRRSQHAPPIKASSNVKTIGRVNGFRALPEPLSVRIEDERNIAPFSLPQEALTLTPSPADVVQYFGNGDSERMIFCNTELTPTELKWLDNCRRKADANQEAFIPSITVAAGRFLGDVGGDVEIALERMRDAQAWRLKYFQAGPITDTDVYDDLQLGILYFCGRDYALRPLLVVRPSKIPVEFTKAPDCADRFSKAFLFMMEYFLRYMVVPGHVENICVLLDLKGVSLKQVPLSALVEIKKVLSQQHAGRVYRFYICNMPPILAALASVVKAAMTERQRQKMCFVRDVVELRQFFAAHQLDVTIGGTRPANERKFPFPLPPGPFHAGHDAGPADNAMPNLHRIMTADGVRGKVWDPSKSEEQNTKLELSPGGNVLLRQAFAARQSPRAGSTPTNSMFAPDSARKGPALQSVAIEAEEDCWQTGWGCAACAPERR
eukprot:CAMPEP_0178412994 /NCGR_PEP_ID=MMETSP0689_2-20121128/22301_1 /TAXON_ID=160604 /ORGANISM="Amphidinium massartii, Strain CS-259" /LENGTH=464 /DNA_ID=CAMNT_0020034257 /DNA_START=30 /DNA_END=1421 /DNA_ORIENTATION=-